MATKKKTVRTSGGRVPNDPLDWVGGIGEAGPPPEAEEPVAASPPPGNEQENGAPEPPVQTTMERKGESPMSETSKGANMKAVQEIQRVLEAIKNGQLHERASLKGSEGEWSEALEGVNALLDNLATPISHMMTEMNHMSAEHDKGDIDVMISVNKFHGEFARMAQGVNDMVAGHIAVKKKAMACVGEFANGNFEAPLDKFPGKKAFINDTIEGLRANLKALMDELQRLIGASSAGQLSERGKAGHLKGDFAGLIGGVNSMLDEILIPIGEGNRILDQIAKGKIDELIAKTYQGDHEKMKQNVNGIALVLQKFQAEFAQLTEYSRQGQLEKRGNVGAFAGAYADIVKGANEMLDAILIPIGEGNRILDQIAKGKIDELIAKTYQGDHEKMKQNVNGIALVLQKFQAEFAQLTEYSRQGQLEKRGNVGAFVGVYADIVKGANEMLDAILIPIGEGNRILDQIAKGKIDELIAKTYQGDHEKMKQNVNGIALVLQKFQAEFAQLTEYSRQGQLEKRGNVGAFAGAYADIVKGANEMLDAILIPIGEGNRVLAQISVGNLSERVEIICHGDHQKMKDAINAVHGAVSTLIADATELAQAIVDGNIHVQTDSSKYQGDFRKIIDAFENAFVGLNSTFYQIVDAVEQVAQSAEQLNSASQNMASTSEEQSSSVEEVTSSLEETDSQVKANTDNANAANQLVVGTSQAATQGQVKMEAMTEAMSAINLSSQNIAKIIKVIDEIAFQTNLLALNAAVEAARAGQHGRGFAVVAQEVRNLAGRSAKAARETADLIEDSSKRVTEGVGIANETRTALDEIVGNVVKVKDLVAEIATASAEQSRGVTQINVAMNQVAKAAQEGSQQAEELASSSAELTNVANQMRGEIRRFKLRSRQQSAGLGGAGLEGLSPEMLRQLKMLLAAQQAGTAPATAKVPARAKPPKTVLPLDADERGFGGF